MVSVDEKFKLKTYNAYIHYIPKFIICSIKYYQPIRNKDYSTRRALAFTSGQADIPQRLYFDDYPNNNQGILEQQQWKYKINFELGDATGVSGASVNGGSAKYRKLRRRLSTAGADLHVIDPKSGIIIATSKIERFEML